MINNEIYRFKTTKNAQNNTVDTKAHKTHQTAFFNETRWS